MVKPPSNVTLEGDYNVIQVAGLDSSTFAESDETGREFVKNNPIVDPYPYVNYTFGGTFPVISVPTLTVTMRSMCLFHISIK